MRSRDVRPFAVEHKNKRRPVLAAPSSIWGKAAILFQEGADPSNPMITSVVDDPHPVSGAQVRRVLPDLTTSGLQVNDGPISVPMTPRRAKPKGGEIMQEDIEKQDQHQAEAAPSAPEPIHAANPALVDELVAVPVSSAGREGDQAPERNASTILPQALGSIEKTGLLAASDMVSRRNTRRWVRRVEDLPRAERWKRRLPDVCR